MHGKKRGRPRQLTARQLRQRYNARRRRRWRRIASRRNEQRREKRFRFRGSIHLAEKTGFSIVTAQTLKRPPLLYIDAQGKIRREDFRSAQQLIADWKAAQRKKGRP